MSRTQHRKPDRNTDEITPEPVVPDGSAEIERVNRGERNIEPNRRCNPPVLPETIEAALYDLPQDAILTVKPD